MAKGYWVVAVDVSDAEQYGVYQQFVRSFLAANNGRFIVRGGQKEVVEGSLRSRVVVIEFPSYSDATRVYHSDEYQAGMQNRIGASVADFAIVEGFDS
jgi:uncharacterized protein (DUF1330 family)